MAAAAVAAAALAVVIALIVVVAGTGSGDDATPTPSPTPSPTASPSPTPIGQTPTPTPAPPESAYRLIYREFGQLEDVIWSANPSNPADRVELARIPHREGFGIKPALSPDGKKLAYLSQPEFALSAQSSQAEVHLRDLETGDTVRIGENVDLTFTPLWAPDGEYLYVRQLAGAEFLSAEVMLTRIEVPPIGLNTPTPTPTPEPTLTPVPTPAPTYVLLRDTVAHVLSFIPVGFSSDGDTLFFVQLQGGTRPGTILGMYHPVSTDAINAGWQLYLDSVAAADAFNNASPTPSQTVTPQPTPTAIARLVVEMSEQTAFDYDLSDDGQMLCYVVQEFGTGGETIVSRTYVANIVEASVQALSFEGLPEGHHLTPIWRPGDNRLTVGVLPTDDRPSGLLLVAPDGSNFELLPTRGSGFDEPRSWSPDGAWLALSHSEGKLTNRHDVKLEVMSANGFRATVIEGPDNARVDSVLGWHVPEPAEGG